MHILGKRYSKCLINDGLGGRCEGEGPGAPLLCWGAGSGGASSWSCSPLSHSCALWCCLCRDRRLQHPLSCRGGDGRLHRLPRPQPLPAKHLALPGAAGRHAGAERGADPGGGLWCRPHQGGDAWPHWLRYVGKGQAACEWCMERCQPHVQPLMKTQRHFTALGRT